VNLIPPATEHVPTETSAAFPAATLAAPETMSENGGAPVAFEPWDGQDDSPVDHVISAVRREIFPLYGLDPHDPRD
jgi:acetoin utilization protein AcuC